MRMRLTHAALVGLLLIPGGDAAAQVMSWQVDGETRQAIVHAPESAGAEASPLILSFHGFGDNAQNFQYTNLHVAWPDAIVVYFQGLPTRRGLPGWQVEPGGGNRDLALVDAALASLREAYSIDDDRIYATGYSNGGMFAYLLWAERPGVFAAYAPVAARLRPSVRPTEPRPVFHVAGERDRGGPLLRSGRSRDSRGHRRERRRCGDRLRGRLHGARSRHGGAGHDVDPWRRPHLPRAGRASGSPPSFANTPASADRRARCELMTTPQLPAQPAIRRRP